MAATIETIITCDIGAQGCESTYSNGDARHLTAKQQRALFKGSGWHRVGNKDVCEHCFARGYHRRHTSSRGAN